jgi:hypothetical protein
MTQSSRELWLSFIAIVLITLIYLFVVILFSAIPAASELFGHSLGILGFVLMLFTETLYSWRKRSRSARWGSMASWLQFHIFTGLVGPYMVLLHASWKFNGLAGLVMLLTVIIVASGFMGRYIYTAVPRSADGVEIEAGELQRQVRAADVELQRWLEARPQELQALSQRLAVTAGPSPQPSPEGRGGAGAGVIFGRVFQEWGLRWAWWNARRRLAAPVRQQAGQLEKLLRRQRTLRRQMVSLAMARHLLGLWHAIHIPVGMALFTAAFVHIVAAIYYATLLH